MATTDAPITAAQAQAAFKQIFGDEFFAECPEEMGIQEDYSFERSDAVGESFVQAVRMTEEQGVTFRVAGQPAGAMNPSVGLLVQRFVILGSIQDFKSQIDVEVMMRALSSKQSFKEHVGLRMEAMRDSSVKHNEWSLLNGGQTVGTIASLSGSGTTRAYTMLATDWAGGFIAGSENMKLDAYDPTGVTKRNTNQEIQITSFDLDARVLNVSGNASDLTATLANDILFRKGENGVVWPGLFNILQATSGTINGLNVASFGLLRGANIAVNGQLAMSNLLQLSAKVAERGSSKAKLTARLSPRNFNILNTDLAAQRRYDGSYERTKGDNGFANLCFYSSNGEIVIKPSLFVKDGKLGLTDDAYWTRRGATDITFNIPGADGYFVLVPGQQTFEYRSFSLQGLLCTRPARSGVLTGLVVPN